MTDLNRSQNFTDGDLVTAQKLKDLIDLTTVSPSFVHNKSILFADTLSLNDYLLIYDSSINSYMKSSVEDFVKGGVMKTDTGLKFHRYDNPSSPYGKTWLYAVTPVQNAYCGFLMESTGGSNGQTFETVNFGNLDVSNTSSLTALFVSQRYEAQNFEILAGGGISRSGWGNSGAIYLRTQANTANFFNDWTISQNSATDNNNSSVYSIEKVFDKYASTGLQDGGLGRKTVKALEIGQKIVNGKATDTVEVRAGEELTAPTINATVVDSVNFRKAGATVSFPLRKGYREFEFGSENAAYIGVPDTVLAAGFTIHNCFRLNAITSGGVMIWESNAEVSLKANETYLLRVDIWHNEISTTAGAWIDYRLRLKAKTVGGATYPMREISVRRVGVSSGSGTLFHSMIFRIERSDFPVGGEDITRQLQIHMSESNAHLAYRHYIVRTTAELWNKSDIDSGTAALL